MRPVAPSRSAASAEVRAAPPRPPRPPRRDPAPSRLSYRLQRWLLTPSVRLGLRAGIPALVVFALASAFFADEGRRDALAVFLSELRESVERRPEFMVGVMVVDGAGADLAEDIREVVALDFPVSSFDLDIPRIRAQIAGLDPVRSVAVRIRPGGILQVDVTERRPAVVWRSRDGLELLDESGVHIAELMRRAERPDLPLIAGDGADARVPEALAILAAARPLGARLRGLVRMGERRWDVVLDRGQRILLPEDEPVKALERVIALDQVKDLLDGDVTVVDMRLGERPTLRLGPAAREGLWTTGRMTTAGGTGQ